jgi:hypothetical protein
LFEFELVVPLQNSLFPFLLATASSQIGEAIQFFWVGFSFLKNQKPILLAEIIRLHNRQGGNLQDEFSTNCDFADFLGVHMALPIQKVN